MPVAYGGGISERRDGEPHHPARRREGRREQRGGRAAGPRRGDRRPARQLDARREHRRARAAGRHLRGRQPLCHAGRPGARSVRTRQSVADAGAGEILLTSVDRDGTREGYDLDLISSVARSVEVPVVACGGAGSLRRPRRRGPRGWRGGGRSGKPLRLPRPASGRADHLPVLRAAAAALRGRRRHRRRIGLTSLRSAPAHHWSEAKSRCDRGGVAMISANSSSLKPSFLST